MSTLTIRIDSKLKNQVQKITDDLGISLNQLVNLKLKEFTQTGEIHIELFKNINKKEFNNNIQKNKELLA